MGEDFSEMPKSDAPKMIKIEFAVPAKILEEVNGLIEFEGWKPSELYRLLWLRGYESYCEGGNKRLVNQKLRNELQRLKTEIGEEGESDVSD